jgi:hypothetical protein
MDAQVNRLTQEYSRNYCLAIRFEAAPNPYK